MTSFFGNKHFSHATEWLALLLLIVVPFNYEWKIYGAWVTVADLIMILLCFSAFFQRSSISVESRKLVWLCAVFLLLNIIASASGINHRESIKEFLKFAGIFAGISLLAFSPRPLLVRYSSALIVISATITSFWFLYDWYFHPALFETEREWKRIYGPFGQLNILGTYIALSLPFAVHEYLNAVKRHARILVTGAAILQTAVVLLSFSRSSLLAVTASLIILFLLMKELRVRIFQVVGIGLLVSFVFVSPSRLLERVASVVNITESSNAKRLEYAQLAIKITKENPLWGVGTGNYKQAALKLSPEAINIYEMAHNITLQLSAESGIPSAIVFYMIVGYSMLLYIRRIRSATADERSLLVCAMAAYIGLLVNVQFGDPLVRNIKEYFIFLTVLPFIVSRQEGCYAR
jgi:O-antigen ligase